MKRQDAERLEETIFNESRLYDALGKEDARTVLAIWRQFKGAKKLGVLAAVQNAREAAHDAEMEARYPGYSDDDKRGPPYAEYDNVMLCFWASFKNMLDGAYSLAMDIEALGRERRGKK